MSIHKLPAETLCKIFVLSTLPVYPPFTYQGPGIEPRIYDFDIASPDVIAAVCKRWREIALSDPALWSNLFLSLHDLKLKTLIQTTIAVEHCLTRSGDRLLSCFVTVNVHAMRSIEDYKRAFQHLLPLFEHQTRWRSVDFRLPSVQRFKNGSDRNFVLSAKDLASLEAIRMDTRIHDIRGFSPLPSLTTLELVLDDEREAPFWLSYCPNLETLSILWELDGRSWHGHVHPTTLNKLRSLRLNRTQALESLDCPALEDLTINNGVVGVDLCFEIFLSRSPPLRKLHISNILLSVLDSPATMEKYLVPTLTHLSLSLNGHWNGSPSALFEVLSRKRLNTFSADAETFLMLPELESLVLIGAFFISLPNLVEFVATRWNVQKKTMKSMRITRCFIQLAPNAGYFSLSKPEISSAVLEAMKPFTTEGLVFEVS